MSDLVDVFRTRGFRIPRYFLVIEAISFTAYLFFTFAPLLYPSFFTWIEYKTVWFIVWPSLIVLNIISAVCLHVFRKDYFFYLTNYAHAAFHLVVIYITGGITSPFVILLVIPLLISAIYLNPVEIGVVGVVLSVVYGSFMFLPPYPYQEPEMVTFLFAQLINYGIIVILMYRTVRETLLQKYERQHAQKIIDEQAELDEIKTAFVQAVSHQLRTPLSAIVWALGDLRENPSSEDAPEMIEQSHDRAQRAMDIVNSMIQTAELGTKNLSLDQTSEPLSLTKTINDILGDLTFLISRNETSISFDENEPCQIRGDRALIAAALTNIIDNAVRYSPGGSVTISIDQTEDNAVIAVKDTGVGIPEHDLNHVFERFYRGDNAVKIAPNQSGIGLYNAKKVIEMHGGSIDIESKEGEGTTVKIQL